MPEQFFPLFKHAFGKDYPEGASIELLTTEYSAPGKSSPENLSSVFADIVMRIAGTDIYHLEGQMEKDKRFFFRLRSCVFGPASIPLKTRLRKKS